MINNFFYFYVNSIFATCIFIVLAFFLRFLFKKRPSSQLYLIWIFVLIRLLLPVSIPFNFGLVSYTQPHVLTNIISTDNKEHKSAFEDTGSSHTPSNKQGLETSKNSINYFEIVWFSVGLLFLLNYIIKSFSIRQKTKKSTVLSGYKNVMVWPDQTGACVIGLLHPHIYVPYGCNPVELNILIRHEQQHIKHLDYLFVPFFYLALALNWYNPLAWIAYRTAIQDIEKACDEHVLINATLSERKEYAHVLLDFYKKASNHALTLSFGKNDIVQRIKNIGEQKKSSKIYSIIITLVCISLLSIAALSHAKSNNPNIAASVSQDPIGASIPDMLYVANDICIFYDYHGVFIYDFEAEQIAKYISFSDIGFSTNTEGDNATFAFTGNQGNLIYITNHKKLYFYNCSTKESKSITYSESIIKDVSIDSPQTIEPQNTASISPIYKTQNNVEIYWICEGNQKNYSDLQIILNKNGNIRKYPVFR